MSTPINPLFTLAANVNCSCGLNVQVTSGGQTGTGIVLFWSPDSWTTIYQDLSQPANGQWMETLNLGGVWDIQAYIVEQYSPHASYSTNNIVWYNGVLYYTTSDGVGVPGTGGSHWTVMPSNAISAYALFQLDITSDDGETLTWTIASVNATCNAIVVTKTSCGQYNVCNNTAVTQFFSVTDIGNNLISGITFGDTNATPVYDVTGLILLGWSLPANTCTSMTLPKEGLYVINYGVAITCMSYQTIIFNLCKYYDCYFGLIKDILCNDFDPCCDNKQPHKRHGWFGSHKKDCNCNECNAETIRQHEIFRLTLNKMQALINTIQIKSFYDNIHYGMLNNITPNRAIELTEIQEDLNMLNHLIIRCGLCNGAWTTQSNSPCGCGK